MKLKDIKGKISYKTGQSQETIEFDLSAASQNTDVVIIPQIEELAKEVWRLSVFLQVNEPLEVTAIVLEGEHRYRNTDKVFVNGFQSWSSSREYTLDEKMPKLSGVVWKMMSYYGDYTFYPYPNEDGYLHSHGHSYVKDISSKHTFIGSVNEQNGYTIIAHESPENKYKIIKECAGLKVDKKYQAFDLIMGEGSEEEMFKHWHKAMDLPKPKVEPTTGWTSWYYHYTKITEEIILDNLEAFHQKSVPIDVFQIDDGYQKAVGDWMQCNEKFPNGMKPIADAVHHKGYKAGLWLAPFICQFQSDVFQKHPDWLLTYDGETPVKIGLNPGWGGMLHGYYYALDFYNEEVRTYLKEVFNTVLNTWEFDMVKLDFLFAVAVIPQHGKTRAQVMSEAMLFIQEVCGDKKVLGCGVPLGPTYGKVDYCRIGADIGLKWDLKSAGNVHMRESISTVNSIKDTIHRRHLNGHAFLNDPDVFILRDKKNKLKAHQKYTLFLINHIFGGLVFTSDNINEYDEATLDLYKSVFPHQEKVFLYANEENELYEIAFKVGESEYFVLANLSKKSVTGKLPGGKYYYRERGFTPGHGNVDLEAYQSLCFLKCPEEPYKVAGGNTHLFPGSEVEKVSKSGDGIEVNIHPQTLRKGHVYITIPEQNHRIDVNGQDMPSEKIYGLKMVKVEFGGGD